MTATTSLALTPFPSMQGNDPNQPPAPGQFLSIKQLLLSLTLQTTPPTSSLCSASALSTLVSRTSLLPPLWSVLRRWRRHWSGCHRLRHACTDGNHDDPPSSWKCFDLFQPSL